MLLPLLESEMSRVKKKVLSRQLLHKIPITFSSLLVYTDTIYQKIVWSVLCFILWKGLQIIFSASNWMRFLFVSSTGHHSLSSIVLSILLLFHVRGATKVPKMLEDEHRTDPGRILARATFNLRNFRPSCTPRPNSLTRIAPVKRRLMYARLKKTKEEEGKTDLRKFDGPISFALFDRHTGLITRISREQNMHE